MKINLIDGIKTYIETYFVKTNSPKPCFIIVPGGGYHHTSNRESTYYAQLFNRLGMHAVVLYYREELYKEPQPQKDLAETIKFLKQNSAKYHILKDNINLIGFSAGGHLIASTMCHMEMFDFDITCKSMMLGYPVITSDPKYAHMGSFTNLLEEEFGNRREFYSLEKHVHEKMPKTFIWNTVEDQSVNVMNSILFIQALIEKNNYVEYHLFNDGLHGLSSCTEHTAQGEEKYINEHASIWIELYLRFIKKDVFLY